MRPIVGDEPQRDRPEPPSTLRAGSGRPRCERLSLRDSAKTRTRGRLLRKAVATVILLALCTGVVALLVWGTRWTVPRADVPSAGYELAGYWDGADWPAKKLSHPFGIAAAPDGDVYVTDAQQRVVHLGPDGQFKGQWGREGREPGEFSNPVGIAVAAGGSVFVSDYDLDRIQQFTPDGKFLRAFGNSGDGPGRLSAPAGLAVDTDGAVYAADFYNHRVQKFERDGSSQKIIGRPGRIGGGALHYPTDVCLDPHGYLIVADAYNYQLQWFDANGQPKRRLGYHLFWLWPRPNSTSSGFNVPTGVAVDSTGIIHVADSGNQRVVMLSAKGEFLVEWAIPDANPKMNSPEHLAVSPDGRTVYATDFAANRIIVLRLIH